MSLLETTEAVDRPAAPRKHIPALDGVRGLAIFLVLMDHYLPWGDEALTFKGMRLSQLLVNVFTRIPRSSWCGVNLFFVLSGFLITGILWNARGSENYFRNFYMRRFLRIFPLYYGTLIIMLVLIPSLMSFQSPEAALVLSHRSSFWFYTVNLAIAKQGEFVFSHGPFWLNHFWSLSIEEQFYLVWPLAVCFLSRRTLLSICGGFVFIAIATRCWMAWRGYTWVSLFVFTPSQCDALAIGSAIALAPGGLTSLLRPARKIALICGAAILLIVAIAPAHCLDQRYIGIQTIGYTLVAGFFGAILIFAASASRDSLAGKFWSHPTLRFLGKYSYGIYVLHEVLHPVYEHLFPLEWLQRRLHGNWQGDVAYFLLASVISIAAAVVSYHLFEVHFLSLKKLFDYKGHRTEASMPQVASAVE